MQGSEAGAGNGRTSGSVSSARCALPAGVPTLPPQVRVTTEMKQLLSSVLSFDASVSLQQGFCGMGGIGKTTVSTWLVRQLRVRETFSQICWVPLGMFEIKKNFVFILTENLRRNTDGVL